MTREARTMAGIILITVPTIQYGGYFLLTSLQDRTSHYMENALRQNFFRAGHAHAGVFVILSLVCQIFADAARLSTPWLWLARLGVPAAAILIPARLLFFDALAASDSAQQLCFFDLRWRGAPGSGCCNPRNWPAPGSHNVIYPNPVK